MYTDQLSNFVTCHHNSVVDMENWYAVQTRSRHEKVVAHRLTEQGITTFLPTIQEEHRWSDRKKIVELPLFSCYVFAKVAPVFLVQPPGVSADPQTRIAASQSFVKLFPPTLNETI